MDEQLKNLINSLSVENFRFLIQEFNKEKYNTKEVRITDGPYDGGNDLEITIEGKQIKKNIQVTVVKLNYEKKLEEDIIKAKSNVEKHGYQSRLDFYINQNISKSKRDTLESQALRNHEIELKIIDANILSNDAKEYSSIRTSTYKAHGINEAEILKRFKKEEKYVFDILASNKNTVEIRKNLIYSLIFSYLYNHPNSTFSEINNALKNNFRIPIEQNYIFNELNYLKSKGYITSNEAKTKFSLTSNKSKEIDLIKDETTLHENNLIEQLEEFLSNEEIDCDIESLLIKIHEIYSKNYIVDIEEITKTTGTFNSALKRSFNDLSSFLEKNGVEVNSLSRISRSIINICSSNDYLIKMATTNFFMSLYSSEKLEHYFNNNTQHIILDTQILIRLISIYFKENYDFEEMEYIAVKGFRECINKFTSNVKVYTTDDYIDEVVGHFLEALKLQRFMKLPFIQDLGKSKNVYYNLFLKFKSKSIIEDEIELNEFLLKLLGLQYEEYNIDESIKEILHEQLREIFRYEGIEIFQHPNYVDSKKYNDIYAESIKSRSRTEKAKKNDARTVLLLSTGFSYLEELNSEPTLITWDSSFYDVRKRLRGKKNLNGDWFIYNPLKFVDKLSVLNFKVEPKCITHNIVALVESNFNINTNDKNYFDVISSFFNIEDVSSIKIIGSLTKLKKELFENESVEETSILSQNESSLTTILLLIRDYFMSKSTNSFDDLIELFEENDNEVALIQIIKEAIQEYKFTNSIKHSVSRIDKMI